MVARSAKTPAIVEVNNASFTTSSAADATNDEFMRRLGLKSRNMAARLAIARSLSVAAAPHPIAETERGRAIKGVNLFGDDLRMWLAYLLEHHGAEDVALDEVQELVGRHWARGANLLEQDWRSANDDFDKFVMSLASQAGLRSEGGISAHVVNDPLGLFAPRATAVTIEIGDLSEDVATRKTVDWALNGPNRSPHIAIAGGAGTGKTRTGVTMLRSIRKQTGVPIILFDMAKGDLASDARLVEALGATVVDPLQQAIPLDVLYATAGELKAASMRFRESFKRVPANKIGDAQGDVLREAAERAYAGSHPVRLSDVYDRLKELYAEKRKKDDVVTAAFKDMTAWDLFEPKMPPAAFFSRSWIIDVHRAPEAVQRLITFLIVDAAHAYLGHQEDSPMDADGNRALRLVVAIDEARRVLGYEHQSLISIVRESRSKGGVMMFISQSPDDFDQKNENFFENIGLGVCFRTNARSSALNAMLGQAFDLAGLKDGTCVTRLVDRGVTVVRAW